MMSQRRLWVSMSDRAAAATEPDQIRLNVDETKARAWWVVDMGMLRWRSVEMGMSLDESYAIRA